MLGVINSVADLEPGMSETFEVHSQDWRCLINSELFCSIDICVTSTVLA
jgi:hypothetical protein